MTDVDFETLYQTVDPWRIKRSPHNKRRLAVLRSLKQIFKEKKILEVGCGEGTQTSVIAELGQSVVAFDISETAISRAKRLQLSNVDFRVSSMTEFQTYGDFEVIVLLESLYYLTAEDQSRTLSAIKIDGAGTLIISAPVIGANQFRKYYTESELVDLLSAHGFSIVESRVVGIKYPPTKIERLITLAFKAIYLSPMGGILDGVWDNLPDRWVYQKLFVCRY
jgi:SAM-dependent methyltransferase